MVKAKRRCGVRIAIFLGRYILFDCVCVCSCCCMSVHACSVWLRDLPDSQTECGQERTHRQTAWCCWDSLVKISPFFWSTLNFNFFSLFLSWTFHVYLNIYLRVLYLNISAKPCSCEAPTMILLSQTCTLHCERPSNLMKDYLNMQHTGYSFLLGKLNAWCSDLRWTHLKKERGSIVVQILYIIVSQE